MEEVNARIIEKLNLLEEDPNGVKSFMMQHLINIETYLIEVEKDYLEALEKLKLQDCSVSAIAKEFKMSRTTFYNHNQLLKRYIEASYLALEGLNPVGKNEKSTVEINALKEQIDKMYERDISMEIQKHEISELTRRIKEQSKTIERLQERNIQLNSENIKLKKECKKDDSGKVVNIVSKKN